MSNFVQFLDQLQVHSQLSQPFFYLVPLLFTLFLIKWVFSTATSNRKYLPPSPPKLPIIGNLHQLGLFPHQSLRALALQHGPIMLLWLGTVPALVISSADAASKIMRTYDLAFADRPKSNVNKKLIYNFKDVSVAPYGEYWRQMKSICVLQLLSNKRVQSIRCIREEETVLLVKKINELGTSPVDLSEMFMSLTNDVVCRAAFGRKYSEGESGKKFRKLMSEFVGLLGGFDVGTYIPRLAWINRLTGFEAKLDRVAKEFNEFLEGVVKEHLVGVEREKTGGEDFVDVLLGIYKESETTGFCIDRDSIKALILDIIAGGTDTTYTVLEWAMTELLRDPRAMNEAQKEARTIARGKTDIIHNKDLKKMQYLQAVIKETMRLHPPIPLLIPREAREDVKLMGYDISAGTMVITNAWAIGRDPGMWAQPEEFRPERFLNSPVDFKGHDFQLIPFGAGRRGCPGIFFAVATIELVLANLLNKFDWELPNGAKGEDLDMSECTGLTIHRKIPLLAVATPRSF